METATISKIEYKKIFQEQKKISQAVTDLVMKFKVLGTLEDFEKLARWGRQFAKKKGLKPSIVLKND